MSECRISDLGPGRSVEELVVRAAGRPGLVCLRGSFAGGRPLITSHPVRTAREPGPQQQPVADDGTDVVGGGWFGVAGFDRDTSWFGCYDHVVRLVDGRWRFEALWTPERAAALASAEAEWAALLRSPAPERTWRLGEWALPDRDRHLAAVERAIELIRAGELYQVNVCIRLSAPFDGDPTALFAAAAGALDPAFGAYVSTDRGAVVCLSPELFWRRRGVAVTSAPIKGTLPVGPGNAERLLASAKDVAENVMIVDLVRNDLGRVCTPGSVRPTRLLDVVERVGVLHLVSVVDGDLRPGVTDAEVSAALFPPASVTGTPKLRALTAIADLERAPRGAYTGAVGFTSPCWGAEWAVAIRTVEVAGGRAELGVGGGITVDSVPDAEWQECLHKARPVVRACGGVLPAAPPASVDAALLAGGVFETVLIIDGRPVRLADHLARLGRSAHELYGVPVPADVAGRAAAASTGLARGALRVTVRPDGAVAVAARPVGPPPSACAAVVVPRPPGCWRHKWADRGWAERAEAGGVTPLFVAGDGAVLETARGNVFLLEPDGTLVTPPLREDLLPGVTRRALLDHARDTGRPTRLETFGVEELRAGVAFWTSSLSGAVPIHSLDGVPLPRDDGAVAAFGAVLAS